MTAILDISENKSQTHAIIIGVGAYTHLLGGVEGKILDDPLDLEQLTSPPISARALAGWMLKKHFDPTQPEGFWNPAAPLGSVELLLSEHLQAAPDPYTLPDGTVHQVDNATIDNILKACERWRDRCDKDKGNVALFYFCGHGVAKGDTFLLAEDFGANRHQPFEGALNFNLMRLGMDPSKARVQCYFVDACRNVPSSLLKDPHISGRNPFGGNVRATVPNVLTLYATSHNDTANGLQNDKTRFTKLLLDALNGLGSKKDKKGQWVVKTNDFGGVMRNMMQHLAEKDPKASAQDCDVQVQGPGPGIFHQLTQPPLVPAIIHCAPSEAIPEAEFCYTFRKNPAITAKRPPAPQPWELKLVPGAYDVWARFPGGGYKDCDDVRWVEPPMSWYDEPLAVEELP